MTGLKALSTFLGLTLILYCCVQASAQNNTGKIKGKIRVEVKEKGAIKLKDGKYALVIAIGEYEKRVVRADSDGEFSFYGLTPGNWEILALMKNYCQPERASANVLSNDSVRTSPHPILLKPISDSSCASSSSIK
jgi:hypothetical protein